MPERVVLKIYDHDKLGQIPLPSGKWTHAFLRLEDGTVVLAEVHDPDGGDRGWCPAGPDCVSSEHFDRINKDDPDYYGGMGFQSHMAWALRSCFKVEVTDESNDG